MNEEQYNKNVFYQIHVGVEACFTAMLAHMHIYLQALLYQVSYTLPPHEHLATTNQMVFWFPI